MRTLTLWLALAIAAGGATPPRQPANPVNRDGFWVGQSEPGTPCFTQIVLSAEDSGKEIAVRGAVTVLPHEGARPKVVAEWISPNGRHEREVEIADDKGVAHFRFTGPRGEYRLQVLEVLKVRFRYTPELGIRSRAIAPEKPQPPGGI